MSSKTSPAKRPSSARPNGTSSSGARQRPQSAPSKGKKVSKEERERLKAAFERLSKPVQRPQTHVSSLLGDVANCVFHPEISKTAKEMQGPEFMQRLDSYTKQYHQNLVARPPLEPSTFTFRPRLNHTRNEHLQGDFVDRMVDDFQKRMQNYKEQSQKMDFDFTPQLSQTSRKYEIKSPEKKAPFLERLARDIETRKQNLSIHASESQQRESSSCTFKPQVHVRRKAKADDDDEDDPDLQRSSWSEFLSRMEADIENRDRKDKYRARLFGLITPPVRVAGRRPASARARTETY